MKSKLPSIFEYNNFRRFLGDYQEARYAVDREFSKSAICKKLGLPRTRSYFNDVLNGKDLTKTFVERFVEILEFKKHEAQFFRVLVQFNQANIADERDFYFEQLISLNRTPTTKVDPRAYAFYGEWYHNVIRALLDIVDFKGDYSLLAKSLVPPISVKKAKGSIELLTSLGLIRQDERGFLKPTDKSITTGPAVRDELVKQYQMKCIELATSALLQSGGGLPHSISTNTVSISEPGLKRLEKLLEKFRIEVRSLVHKDENPADRVYQLNIQLFPGSR